MKYGVTIGEGDLADMGLVQLRSLHRFAGVERDDIIVNCPPAEWDDISVGRREAISALGYVHRTPPTISGYSPSASHATALCAADAAESGEAVAVLDTDTVVLRSIENALDWGGEVALKRADFHPERVGLSMSTYRAAFEAADTPIPDRTIRTTVDGKEMPAYWNAGVIISRSGEFIHQWVDLSEQLYDHFPDEFFLDQLSLAVAATEFNATSLPESYNFLLPQRLWVPSRTRVVHYHRINELRWVSNPIVYRKLRQIGTYDQLRFGSVKHQLKLPAIKFARLRLRR